MARKALKRRQLMLSEDEERYIKHLSELEDDTINNTTRKLINNALSCIWPDHFLPLPYRYQLKQRQQPPKQREGERYIDFMNRLERGDE